MTLLDKYPSILNWLKPKFSNLELKKIKFKISKINCEKLYNMSNQLELNILCESIQRKIDQGYKLLCPTNPEYPSSISFHIQNPTPILYKGELNQTKKVISVVGSRKMTISSKEWMNEHFYKFLKQSKQYIVASGGAYGVDQMAHRVSILSETPSYCVIPAGFNNVYPKNLVPLIEQIISEGGAVFSPFPPNFPIYKSNFYYRNRVLVLLSDVVLIVEAQRRSGTMMTASLAAEYGVRTLTLSQVPLRQYMGNLDLMSSGVPFVSDSNDLLIKLNE